MNEIYVSRGGEQFGPYSLEDISRFVDDGIFAPTDHAWKEDMSGWVELHTMLPPKILPSPAVPPPSSTVPTGTRSSQCCPHCGSHDHYYKVSALYEVEISQLDSSTIGVAVGISGAGLGIGVGKAKTAGTIQTNLASKLEPPPSLYGDGIDDDEVDCAGDALLVAWIGGFAFIGLGVGLSFWFDAYRFDVPMDWWLWLIISIPILIGISIILSRDSIARAGEKERAIYKKERAAWERRWYCKKCGQFSEPSIH